HRVHRVGAVARSAPGLPGGLPQPVHRGDLVVRIVPRTSPTALLLRTGNRAAGRGNAEAGTGPREAAGREAGARRTIAGTVHARQEEARPAGRLGLRLDRSVMNAEQDALLSARRFSPRIGCATGSGSA